MVLVILALIVVSLLLAARGLYVLATDTPRRTFVYLGTVFGVFLIIWTAYELTGSDVFRSICAVFLLPFGSFAAAPFLLLIDRHESLMSPGAWMFPVAALLNLSALCGTIEFIERIVARRRLS